VLFSFFVGESEYWGHVTRTLLSGYLLNTLYLGAVVLVGTFVIGVGTAWLVTQYTFLGKRFFSWGLMLPLALSAYISAYTYAGMFDYTGIGQTVFRNILGLKPGSYPVIDLMNLPGSMFILTVVLYPYVYLAAKASFLQQSGTSLEAARILGMSATRTFVFVALPLSRPALVGGAALVLMETLNEYGTLSYFGVPTFTVGILRVRFSLGDLTAALRLSAILLLLILLLLSLEKQLRGRKRFDFSGGQFRPTREKEARGIWKFLFPFLCALPLLAGFVIPVGQLLAWSGYTIHQHLNREFWGLIGQSFFLAAITTGLILVTSITLVHILRGIQKTSVKLFSNFFNLGYAVPGAVIAIGIMAFFGSADKFLRVLLSQILPIERGLFLSGTFGALILAYLIRFLAIANKQIEPGMGQVTRTMHEAARSLGKSSFCSLVLIDLPLSKMSVLAAGLLVFIEVLKELPLTLILRPFNFDTLATRSFELASDEMLAMSAPPALMTVCVSVVAIVCLNHMFSRKRTHNG
jgi:iron(III) transport system permease protein